MNKYQQALLQTYGQGDYAHLIHMHDQTQIEPYLRDHGGDTLVLFLYRELADDGDTDLVDYLARLQVAVNDIEHVLTVLRGVE